MKNIKNLNAIYTQNKSYYGKAKEIYHDNGDIELQSYDTIVCKIDKHHKLVKLWNGYSRTTMKHIIDFCKQHNINNINGKHDWDNLPCANTSKYKIVGTNVFLNDLHYEPTTTFDDIDDCWNYIDKISSNNMNYYYEIKEL